MNYCFHNYGEWSKFVDTQSYGTLAQYRKCKKCGKIQRRFQRTISTNWVSASVANAAIEATDEQSGGE